MTIEDELFKRAFWVLIVCDALLSAAFGRPRATNDDEFCYFLVTNDRLLLTEE
jgi:hypothetical protein